MQLPSATSPKLENSSCSRPSSVEYGKSAYCVHLFCLVKKRISMEAGFEYSQVLQKTNPMDLILQITITSYTRLLLQPRHQKIPKTPQNIMKKRRTRKFNGS